jgi:signal transduction histidine kinase
MPQKILQWFGPPQFPVDEDKTRIAGMLHSILLVFLSAIIIAIMLALTGSVDVTNRAFFNLSVVVAPGLVITMLILLHKGHVNLVAWIFIFFQWLSTVTQVLGSGGIESPAVSAFIATLLLAGFLINGRAVAIFAGLSVLVLLRVWQLESLGRLPPPLMFGSLNARFFFIMVLMAVTAALLNMVLHAFNHTLIRSRTYAQELEQVIHAKTQAEEKINKLNEELQQQVAELERFTYTVSHDLRSPLVTIKGFLGMLDKDIREHKPDRVQADFQRIENATDKMDALLTDLLELSRIGRIVNPPEEIELVRLVYEAAESVDARLRANHVTLTIAPDLPIVMGDKIRLREVFQNLIDNAAKYTGNQHSPMIEIGIRQQGELEAAIFVRDNGLGIDPQYHSRIFNLFEKLNPTIEGTGIGLALVKRIIEIHGGKIWVESEGLGRGSTFCFTVPGRR